MKHIYIKNELNKARFLQFDLGGQIIFRCRRNKLTNWSSIDSKNNERNGEVIILLGLLPNLSKITMELPTCSSGIAKLPAINLSLSIIFHCHLTDEEKP